MSLGIFGVVLICWGLGSEAFYGGPVGWVGVGLGMMLCVAYLKLVWEGKA